ALLDRAQFKQPELIAGGAGIGKAVGGVANRVVAHGQAVGELLGGQDAIDVGVVAVADEVGLGLGQLSLSGHQRGLGFAGDLGSAPGGGKEQVFGEGLDRRGSDVGLLAA